MNAHLPAPLLLAAVLAIAGCSTQQPHGPDASTDITPAPAPRATAPPQHPASRAVAALHQAASDADAERYFALFTPDAVFLGTDPDERWTRDEFRAFVTPYFADGRGWTYIQITHHLSLSDDGDTAWFDEELLNDSYGRCRGSGVVERGTDGRWRIAQYNLTIPVPNDLASDLVSRIRASHAKQDLPPDPPPPTPTPLSTPRRP